MSTERMGSEEPIGQLPRSLQLLAEFERFRLHKVELFMDTSEDPTFNRAYLPQNCGAFQLPCYWVRRQHFYVYAVQNCARSDIWLMRGDGAEMEVLFPIHPAFVVHHQQFLRDVEARDAADEGLHVWAVPTSSVRTLLCWPDRRPELALFIKTSFHSPVFGGRLVHRRKAGRSVGLSGLVSSIRELPAALTCLREPLGIVPRRMQDGGIVVRSIPDELKQSRTIAVPLFALFGGQRERTPLFLTIAERSGLQPLEFVEHVLCRQFARLWLELSMRFGLLLEAHGQDLLLALTPEFVAQDRFFYRDLEGLQVDWDLLRSRGHGQCTRLPHAFAWQETYASWGYSYSQLVSYKLRISLFDYLYFVLNELNDALLEWQDRGLIRGYRFEKDDLATMFSEQLRQAVCEMFGVRFGDSGDYNIYHSLNKFIIFVLRLRRELIRVDARRQHCEDFVLSARSTRQ